MLVTVRYARSKSVELTETAEPERKLPHPNFWDQFKNAEISRVFDDGRATSFGVRVHAAAVTNRTGVE